MQDASTSGDASSDKKALSLPSHELEREASNAFIRDIMPQSLQIERQSHYIELFDPNVPLSHFDKVADDVYRSGRPKGMEGVKEAVEKVWGDQQFDPEHARKTTIVELRGASSGSKYQPNEDEVKAEIDNCAELGITHARFPMITKEHQDATFIQSVLDYIDQQKAAGQKVLIHCFRGTDRTGTISAAYELTHNAELEQLVKDNPDEAYKRGLKSMTDNGFSPAHLPNLAQSLKDFVNWKHDKLTEAATTDTSSPSAGSAGVIEMPSLWRQTA